MCIRDSTYSKDSRANLPLVFRSGSIPKVVAAEELEISEKQFEDMVGQEKMKGKDFPFVKRIGKQKWIVLKAAFYRWLSDDHEDGEQETVEKTTPKKRGRPPKLR